MCDYWFHPDVRIILLLLSLTMVVIFNYSILLFTIGKKNAEQYSETIIANIEFWEKKYSSTGNSTSVYYEIQLCYTYENRIYHTSTTSSEKLGVIGDSIIVNIDPNDPEDISLKNSFLSPSATRLTVLVASIIFLVGEIGFLYYHEIYELFHSYIQK